MGDKIIYAALLMVNYLHVILTLFIYVCLPQSHAVPQPNLMISQSNQLAYNGTQLSLACTITLSDETGSFTSEVDVTWNRANQLLMTNVSACVTITTTTRVNEVTFQSTLILDPLGDENRSGGVYTCEVNIVPEPNTMFDTSRSFETSHTLDVLGKYIVNLLTNSLRNH